MHKNMPRINPPEFSSYVPDETGGVWVATGRPVDRHHWNCFV